MTLHEAIAQLLRQSGTGMSSTEIAGGVNGNRTYRKKDGSKTTASEIRARVNQYPDLFERTDKKTDLVHR